MLKTYGIIIHHEPKMVEKPKIIDNNNDGSLDIIKFKKIYIIPKIDPIK